MRVSKPALTKPARAERGQSDASCELASTLLWEGYRDLIRAVQTALPPEREGRHSLQLVPFRSLCGATCFRSRFIQLALPIRHNRIEVNERHLGNYVEKVGL